MTEEMFYHGGHFHRGVLPDTNDFQVQGQSHAFRPLKPRPNVGNLLLRRIVAYTEAKVPPERFPIAEFVPYISAYGDGACIRDAANTH